MREIIIEVPDRFGKTLKPERVNSEIKGELVRCKDCVKKGNSYLCRFDRDLEEYGSHRTKADDDWFCADGERSDT